MQRFLSAMTKFSRARKELEDPFQFLGFAGEIAVAEGQAAPARGATVAIRANCRALVSPARSEHCREMDNSWTVPRSANISLFSGMLLSQSPDHNPRFSPIGRGCRQRAAWSPSRLARHSYWRTRAIQRLASTHFDVARMSAPGMARDRRC